MIRFESQGDFKNLEKFLKKVDKGDIYQTLERFGREGVRALAAATPVESGVSADSWSYTVKRTKRSASIVWTNNHMAGTTPVVILLQYGHGTGTGGYVQGIDFINPALRPVFDKIAEGVWKEVTAA